MSCLWQYNKVTCVKLHGWEKIRLAKWFSIIYLCEFHSHAQSHTKLPRSDDFLKPSKNYNKHHYPRPSNVRFSSVPLVFFLFEPPIFQRDPHPAIITPEPPFEKRIGNVRGGPWNWNRLAGHRRWRPGPVTPARPLTCFHVTGSPRKCMRTAPFSTPTR